MKDSAYLIRRSDGGWVSELLDRYDGSTVDGLTREGFDVYCTTEKSWSGAMRFADPDYAAELAQELGADKCMHYSVWELRAELAPFGCTAHRDGTARTLPAGSRGAAAGAGGKPPVDMEKSAPGEVPGDDKD